MLAGLTAAGIAASYETSRIAACFLAAIPVPGEGIVGTALTTFLPWVLVCLYLLKLRQ